MHFLFPLLILKWFELLTRDPFQQPTVETVGYENCRLRL